MNRWYWFAGPLVVGVVLLGGGVARADRTPMTRTSGQHNSGARVDITVPYTTNGGSAFGGYSVAPRIYASPSVSGPANAQAKPVYNLPFWGGVQGYGAKSNGATPRSTPLSPRP